MKKHSTYSKSRELSLLCLHLVATASHRISLYVPVFCSFLLYEPISIIIRQAADWSGVSSMLWFGSLLRGLRAMKLVVGAMQTHPVMGWLQRNWGCTLGRTPHTHPSSTPQPSLPLCCVVSQINRPRLRLSQLSQEGFVKTCWLIRSYLIWVWWVKVELLLSLMWCKEEFPLCLCHFLFLLL